MTLERSDKIEKRGLALRGQKLWEGKNMGGPDGR